MVRDLEGKYTKIYPAPSRNVLNVFGGNMTIEEFRNYNKNASCIKELRELKYPMIPTTLVFEETCKGIDETKPLMPTGKNTVTKLNNITTNVVENWKLKRAKPLKNTKGTLESTMGVIIKK